MRARPRACRCIQPRLRFRRPGGPRRPNGVIRSRGQPSCRRKGTPAPTRQCRRRDGPSAPTPDLRSASAAARSTVVFVAARSCSAPIMGRRSEPSFDPAALRCARRRRHQSSPQNDPRLDVNLAAPAQLGLVAEQARARSDSLGVRGATISGTSRGQETGMLPRSRPWRQLAEILRTGEDESWIRAPAKPKELLVRSDLVTADAACLATPTPVSRSMSQRTTRDAW